MLIHETDHYKEYLRAELEDKRFGRGVRSRLAEFLGVQTSFVSLVLSGTQDFSPEHGIRIAEFLGLDKEETRVLVLLIHLERAGSAKLRAHYQAELEQVRKSKNEIKTRVKKGLKELSSEDLQEYYGTWYHAAVHMCLRIPGCDNASSVARALGIEPMLAKASIALLERVGFIKREKGKIVPTEQRFHFGEKSTMLRAHHTNCRTTAIRSLDEMREDSLHYSFIMSIDRKSFEKIRKILLETIEKIDPVVRDAEDREVCAINFDLFSISKTVQ